MNLSENGKKVLIIEPLANGHHLIYLDWIIKGLLDENAIVHLATLNSVLSHPQFKRLREKYPEIKVSLLSQRKDLWEGTSSVFSLFQRECYYYGLYSDYYSKLSPLDRPNFIFVPYLDLCLYAIALLGSPFGQTPWSAIVMRPCFHYRKMGINAPVSYLNIIKQSLFKKILRNSKFLSSMFTIDESLVQYVKKYSVKLQKLQYLSDPAEFESNFSKAEVREKLRLPKDASLILIYGAICSRKGVAELVEAAQQNDFPNNVQILLAGEQDKDIRQYIWSREVQFLIKNGKIHQFNHFLSCEDENMIFSAVDIVWLGYRGHFSMSGVLVQAGQMKLPVISCRAGLVGWYTKKYKLGEVVNIDKPGEIIEAIRKLVSEKEYSKRLGENGYRKFSEHTVVNFNKKISTIFPN